MKHRVIVAYPEETPTQVFYILKMLKERHLEGVFCGDEGSLRRELVESIKKPSVVVIDLQFAFGNPEALRGTSYQGRSGIAFCKWVRSIDPKVPILVMTGDQDIRSELTKLGETGEAVAVSRDHCGGDFTNAVVLKVQELIHSPVVLSGRHTERK